MSRSNLSKLHHIALFTVALLAGCRECAEGPPTCDGTRVISCRWHGDGPFSQLKREVSECPVACADTGQGAECVDSPVPVPECADRFGATCLADSVVWCRGGFPIGTMPCVAGTVCSQLDDFRDPSDGAFCTIGADPDPSCNGGGASYCDAGTQVNCKAGFQVSRFTCGQVDQCRQVAGQFMCTISGDVDPRCGDNPPAWSAFCDDNTGITCWQGVPVNSIGCGDGTCHVRDDGHAECQLVVHPVSSD